MPSQFPQTRSIIGDLQVVSSSDELFNHVDAGLPMWVGEGDRTIEADIVFDRAFKQPPNVTLGLTGVDAAHDQNLRIALQTTNIKTSGFTIQFKTWGDTHIARASVSWQAIGPAKPDVVEKATTALAAKGAKTN